MKQSFLSCKWLVASVSLLAYFGCSASTIIYSINKTRPTLSATTSLARKHLIVTVGKYPIALETRRNATGHLVWVGGLAPIIFDWLSVRYKFNYSILDTNVSTLESEGPNLPGLATYFDSGDCDVILGSFNPTPERLVYLEFVHPFFFTPISLLIPMPDVMPSNIDAIVKPFQLWVWIGLLVAAASVIIVSCLIKISRTNFIKKKEIICEVTLREITMYIVETLLNQGGYIPSKRTTTRLVIGSWCLLTLVLLYVYNGVLISYVTATRKVRPLIGSIDDGVVDSNIYFIVEKGKGVDNVLETLNPSEKGLIRAIADKRLAYSKSRCNSAQQCVDMFKSLPARHVFIESLIALKANIAADYRKTKECKLTIAGGRPLTSRNVGWGLAKRSPHLEDFNRGISILHGFGLINFWGSQLEPDTHPCYSEKDSDRIIQKRSRKPLARLTLDNLSGAFAILGFGYLISTVILVIEIIISSIIRDGKLFGVCNATLIKVV